MKPETNMRHATGTRYEGDIRYEGDTMTDEEYDIRGAEIERSIRIHLSRERVYVLTRGLGKGIR